MSFIEVSSVIIRKNERMICLIEKDTFRLRKKGSNKIWTKLICFSNNHKVGYFFHRNGETREQIGIEVLKCSTSITFWITMVKLLKLIKKKIKTKLLQPLKVITMAQSQYHYIKQIKTVAIFITYIHTYIT